MSRGGAETEGDTESEAGSRLWAVSTDPMRGSNSQTVRSWPELKSDAQPTEPPRRLHMWHIRVKVSNSQSKHLPNETPCWRKTNIHHASNVCQPYPYSITWSGPPWPPPPPPTTSLDWFHYHQWHRSWHTSLVRWEWSACWSQSPGQLEN